MINQKDSGMGSTTRTLVTFAAGAVAGAVTAMLLSPKTGEETRRVLTDGAGKLKESLTDTIQSGIDRIKSKASELGEEFLSNNATGANATEDSATGRTQSSNNAQGAGYGTTGSAYGSGRKS